MNHAEFNEHVVCINPEIIATFGNNKIYYHVKAAIYENRIISFIVGYLFVSALCFNRLFYLEKK